MPGNGCPKLQGSSVFNDLRNHLTWHLCTGSDSTLTPVLVNLGLGEQPLSHLTKVLNMHLPNNWNSRDLYIFFGEMSLKSFACLWIGVFVVVVEIRSFLYDAIEVGKNICWS